MRSYMMKKTLFYSSVILLFVLTSVSTLGILGTMVSIKYEVDEGYWSIEGNNDLTPAQQKEAMHKLKEKGRDLEIQGYLYFFSAVVTFSAATILLFKRTKILHEQKTPTQ
jgi:biopolymer transport protein ExbB/TolQ